MKRPKTAARCKSGPCKPFALEGLERRQLFATVPNGFVDTKIADDLSTPTSLEAAPDGRMFVAEQDGTILIVKNGQLLSTPFAELDVNDDVERGLLGIALDPNFASNKFVYAYYTSDEGDDAHNRIVRLTANGDVAQGGETLLFELGNEAAKWHNGGAMEFGPDGKLYVAVGDHQSGSSAQSLTSLKGKILRLNPDGSIPTDNPFYNQTTGENRAIWARGLRNAYTMTFQPGTGKLYAADVGNQEWEEINEVVRGGNYGWSVAEGLDGDTAAFIDPLYAYQHNVSGGGECIIGGAFYTAVAQQFPASFNGKFFFADFSRSWMKTYNPTNGQVENFATGLKNPTGITVTPDGSIWYLSRNIGAGATGGAVGSLRKITFSSSSNQPPVITDQPEHQLVGDGGTAQFTVGAAGSGTLSFQWNRNGTPISGATSPTYQLVGASAGDDGAVFTCTVTSEYGTVTSSGATLDVAAGIPPIPTILTPADGTTYGGGQQFSYSGSATDAEDGALGASAFTWRVDFHHDVHTHPYITDTPGSTTGTFVIPDDNETSTNVWFRLYLTVTDSSGLSSTTHRDIIPRTSNVTVQTVPAGLSITVDGTPKADGTVLPGVESVKREIAAPATQVVNGVTYTFQGWSDGGDATHFYAFPVNDEPLVATYTTSTVNAGEVYLSDVQPAAAINPNGPLERDQSSGGLSTGDGATITLGGVTYPKGLGVWSKSNITYDLAGKFSTFVADVGIDDAVGTAGAVSFRVLLDGRVAYKSGKMTGLSPTKAINLSVAGKSKLQLIVDSNGSIVGDMADWANARLTVVAPGVTPPPVSNVVANGMSASTVKLDWTDNGGIATGYLIERSSDGGNTFVEAGRVGPSARTFTDTGLATQTQYVYRVYGVNADLESDPVQIVATTLRPAVTFEAETASVLGGKLLSKLKGYTGFGYVDPNVRFGDSITWTFDVAEGGTYALDFRYLWAKARSVNATVEVNGVTLSPLTITGARKVKEWAKATLLTTLQAGTNTVRIGNLGSSGPVIDALVIN